MLDRDLNRNFGKSIGRTSGRIDKGQFTLDGVLHKLDVNNNMNNLHGGQNGFGHKFWDVLQIEQEKDGEISQTRVVFKCVSVDGEEGFPGECEVYADYILREDDQIIVEYRAIVKGEKQTPISMTNHTYWNLSGDFQQRTIHDHTLNLEAKSYLPCDQFLIPLGQFLDCKNQPQFDFYWDNTNQNKLGDLNRLDGKIVIGG